MQKSYHVLFIFISFLLPFSSAASAFSIYDSIFNCFLHQRKIPNSQISKILYSPTNTSFTNLLQSTIRNRRFNATTTPKPAVIIAPKAEYHVSAAVVCARKVGVQVRIRSGGHDYEGVSYVSNQAFLILDMSNFRAVNVSLDDRTAWVESGATLGELYYEISKKSNELAFPGGLCPTVGAGGHISGGGYGNLIRKHGLTVDHVIDARVVNARGRVLDRKSMGEDLFWAIRGGGGASFCIILGFKVKLVPVPPIVTVFRLLKKSVPNSIEALFKFQQLVDKIDNDLFIRILVSPITVNGTKVAGATFRGLFLGNATRLMSTIDSQFPELGLQNSDCKEMPWIDSLLQWTGAPSREALLDRNPNSADFLKRKSDYIKTLIPISGLESIFKKVAEIKSVSLIFNSYGGTMSQIPSSETPFPHRAGNLFKIQYSVDWDEQGEEAAMKYINMTRELYSFMTPFVSRNPRQAYLNYRDLDIGTMDSTGDNSYEQGKVYGLKYFQGNFHRLVRIKTQVDPDNVFRYEQSIPVQPCKGK